MIRGDGDEDAFRDLDVALGLADARGRLQTARDLRRTDTHRCDASRGDARRATRCRRAHSRDDARRLVGVPVLQEARDNIAKHRAPWAGIVCILYQTIQRHDFG